MEGTRRLDAVFRETLRRLTAAGVPSPGLDARLLVCAATGLGHERLIGEPGRSVTESEVHRLEGMVARRLAREPVSRILGEREFWGRSYALGSATLDPRPDTETLVEAALDWLRRRDVPRPTIADLGTGTGCLLISLLCDLHLARGFGIDIDPDAVVVAASNARRYLEPGRAHFICGDWLAPVGCSVDLIVSNPPYVETAEITRLEPEVAAFDPRRALDGGADGLDAYRRIVEAAAGHINPGGALMLEIGADQESSVAELLERGGFSVGGTRRDLSGTIRCIFATLSG
jgi:release factor glutamine methyltransferase